MHTYSFYGLVEMKTYNYYEIENDKEILLNVYGWKSWQLVHKDQTQYNKPQDLMQVEKIIDHGPV